MAHSLTLKELADPLPEGVDQSAPALAWTPDAVPLPTSDAMPEIDAELPKSAGVFISNVHWAIGVCAKLTNARPRNVSMSHFFIRQILGFGASIEALFCNDFDP